MHTNPALGKAANYSKKCINSLYERTCNWNEWEVIYSVIDFVSLFHSYMHKFSNTAGRLFNLTFTKKYGTNSADTSVSVLLVSI